jgi:hypothetical protein
MQPRAPSRRTRFGVGIVRGFSLDMNGVLTVAQIERRFKSEWVLLEDPTTNEALEIQSGRVVCHSKDRDEVYRAATSRRPKRFAVLYTGKLPEDSAIVL